MKFSSPELPVASQNSHGPVGPFGFSGIRLGLFQDHPIGSPKVACSVFMVVATGNIFQLLLIVV